MRNNKGQFIKGFTPWNKGLLKPLEKRYSIDNNGCWNWLGEVNQGGYGRVHFDNRHIAAHKFIYLLKIGEIPKGKELDHLCKNTRCINPNHLEVVTHIVNIRRSQVAKLSIEIVKKIRELYEAGSKQRELAIKFGVDQSQISRVVNNISWEL